MRPKLVVATTFPLLPPRGGGQMRVVGLYPALARLGVDVDIVSLTARAERGGVFAVAPGVRELRVPATEAFERAEFGLHMRSGVPVTDVAVALHADLVPDYGAALREAGDGASAVVACHPFAQPAIAAACGGLPLIYEAQDVEADLKAAIFEQAGELSDTVREVEGACCATAAHAIVCSAEDRDRLEELYGLPSERVAVVPNGVDPGSVPFTAADARARLRTTLGLAGGPLAVFLGSWHEPNLVAVRDVLAAAEEMPEARFLVVGSAGLAFAGGRIPANVDLCGVVDAGFVRSVLGLAHAALNPMRWGSGTNLKMLDYALAGIPILSTRFGARGLALTPGEHYEEIGAGDIAAGLRALQAAPADVLAGRTRAAAARVREHLAWDAIAARWSTHPALRGLLHEAGVA